MPKLFRLSGHDIVEDRANAPFVTLADGDRLPPVGGVIVSLARFRSEGDALSEGERPLGVRLPPEEPVENLAGDLPQLALVALEFPKFRDGRALTAATLLRERFGYKGEIRAVGDVLREQAHVMVRCGFDAFEPADDSTPESFRRSAFRFHHVYQAAADDRPPAFVERAAAGREA
jgi:uncharacterized protein (DUF934 family)